MLSGHSLQRFSEDHWRQEPLGQECGKNKAFSKLFLVGQLEQEYNFQVQGSFYYPLNKSHVVFEI